MERQQAGAARPGMPGAGSARVPSAAGGWMTSGSDTRGPRRLAGPFLAFDIDAELERIRNETEYAGNGRNAITLAKDEGMRVVLVSLGKDAIIGDEEADGTVAIQVIEGTVSVDSRDDTAELIAGQMAVIGAGDPWLVGAREESAVLVTIGAFRTDL